MLLRGPDEPNYVIYVYILYACVCTSTKPLTVPWQTWKNPWMSKIQSCCPPYKARTKLGQRLCTSHHWTRFNKRMSINIFTLEAKMTINLLKMLIKSRKRSMDCQMKSLFPDLNFSTMSWVSNRMKPQNRTSPKYSSNCRCYMYKWNTRYDL